MALYAKSPRAVRRAHPAKGVKLVSMAIGEGLVQAATAIESRMNTESWCQVEGSSNQQWTRATRRHDPQAFHSKVFGRDGPDSSEGRVDWEMGKRPARQKLAQRKHFPEKCERMQPIDHSSVMGPY